MSNRRMAINTSATYLRAVFAAGFALFSSRWVLDSLGTVDYGLFSVMGSIILFVTFLNTVMATSATRQFAFSMGRGNSEEVNRWFNSALGIHLCLALVLVAIAWPVGGYVIGNVLTVPAARLDASLWVYRVSLFSAFASMVSVPFVAMFTAKQHISELAFWGIIQSALTFTLAAYLPRVSGDRFLFYAAGMVTILVFIHAAQVVRALNVFDECVISIRRFDRKKLESILSFGVWNLIGSSGALFRDQGSAILLNLFFGPPVNAAYGIATQLSLQANQLSSAMVGAVSPEIIASEGRGDRARMLSLSHRTSKFGTLLVLLLAVPLIVEMDYVLNLWLKSPPPYTAVFCQLILCTFLIDRLSSGYTLAVHAHGEIAGYQVTIGAGLIVTLLLAGLLFKMGFAPTSIGVAFLVTMTVNTVMRVLWGRRLFGLTVRCWLREIVAPSATLAALATIAAVAWHDVLPVSLLRFALAGASSVVVSLLSMWFIFLDGKERDFVARNFQRFRQRIPLGPKFY